MNALMTAVDRLPGITIYFSFLVLALLPMLIVAALRKHVIIYKQRAVLDELKKLRATESRLVKSWGGESGIHSEIANYYSKLTLMVPAALLSFLYLVIFRFAYVQTFSAIGSSTPWIPSAHTLLIKPIVMTFVGAYLFNLGVFVRRLYVYDLSDNLFWGCVNRLLLSIGLAVVFVAALAPTQDRFLKGEALLAFFAIPFAANKVLVGVVRSGISKLGDIILAFRPRAESDVNAGSSLRDIDGINVWKEYRLEEEGIEEVQNLATSDVIELAVKTHYSLRTLADWVDQALVIARFPGRANKMRAAGVNVSAVELSAHAPQNNGDQIYIAKLSNILNVDNVVLEGQLNDMFQDEYVQTLWTLWQTRPETELGARAVAA